MLVSYSFISRNAILNLTGLGNLKNTGWAAAMH